ncbi:nuclear transport factor 2 family protein [Streptomyces acidiscabies]|uniref:nuclear transport factor 2 family protein n=1 Tax=Streptomyces acidiscabies TaxID=42234 RepID=UPI00073F127C|nr:ester cyclase [Streptomyces acidiscabies]GAQ55200.1 SnoaL-like polyketide cyclase [Streptomyces acidiscabies]
MESNKELVVRFYDSLFNKGDLGVVDELVAAGFVDHVPGAGDGPAALKAAVAGIRAANPGLRVEVVRAVAERDLVLLHVDAGAFAVVGIYRVEGGKIVEHWEAMQGVPAGSDMFSQVGVGGAGSRQVVLNLFDVVAVQRDLSALDQYIAEPFHQHTPGVADGIAAFKARLEGSYAAYPELRMTVARVVAEGNLVAVHHHFQANADDRGMAVVDLFLVSGGKVVEHWDVVQSVPEELEDVASMF